MGPISPAGPVAPVAPTKVIATGVWAMVRPFPLVVIWQTWVASPQVPAVPLTVASVESTVPAPDAVTSPAIAEILPPVLAGLSNSHRELFDSGELPRLSGVSDIYSAPFEETMSFRL
jgi:hypothetical protein